MAPDETSPMVPPASVADGYDVLAQEYARRLYHELDDKPFDRAFLDRFAERVKSGSVLDAGCGPGHVGKYLREHGLAVSGVDISPEMVAVAKTLNPGAPFVQGDMRQLPFQDQSFAAVVAFYSIIHFTPSELTPVFKELKRVLRPEGLLAVAFHIGQQVRHVDELWGIKTNLDFVFLEPAQVVGVLAATGFTGIATTERDPYAPSVEAQTRRCYILARRPADGSTSR